MCEGQGCPSAAAPWMERGGRKRTGCDNDEMWNRFRHFGQVVSEPVELLRNRGQCLRHFLDRLGR